MRRIILLFLLTPLFLAAQDEYYRVVDWRFYPTTIVQLTDSTYQIDATPLDYSEPGAASRIVGNYIVDYVGHRFSVIDSTLTTLTVLDIYHTGQGPQTWQVARCYRSVGNGEAEFIGSVDYTPLDESARWKLNGSDNELLWRNSKQKIVQLNDVDTNYIKLTTTGQIPIWNQDSGYFDFNYNPLSIHEATKEPTGFEHPEDVIVTYNSVNRTVTLTGNTTAFWRGDTINAITSGWTSSQHTATTGAWYLYYNGSAFVWSQDAWSFDMVQIAFVNYPTFAIREPHGFMDFQTHRNLHFNIGTSLTGGGDLSGYTLNSTTASERRPLVSETTLLDEDNPSVEPALSTESYTRFYLSSTNTSNFATASADIIPLSGNNPYYNQLSGGTWTQTLIPTTHYAAVWLVALPVTADAQSQTYRYMWVQPQSTSSTFSTIDNQTASSISLGNLTNLTPEVVFIGKIIIRYIGGDWQFISAEKLIGNKVNQQAIVAGSYLSSVATDSTLLGNGTTVDPLKVDTTYLKQVYAPVIGSGNYIQNQIAVIQPASFSITNGYFRDYIKIGDDAFWVGDINRKIRLTHTGTDFVFYDSSNNYDNLLIADAVIDDNATTLRQVKSLISDSIPDLSDYKLKNDTVVNTGYATNYKLSLKAPSTGSTAYIWNGTSQQTADFNISGTGTFGNTITVNNGIIESKSAYDSYPLLRLNHTGTGGNQWDIHSYSDGKLIFGKYGIYNSMTLTPAGKATFSEDVTAPSIKLTTGAFDGYLLKSDADGDASWSSISSLGVVTGTGTANYIPKWGVGGTSLTATSNIYDDGTNVGIGTAAPTTPWAKVMQVYNESNASISVKTSSNEWHIMSDTYGYLGFADYDGGNYTRRMVIRSNGNVGIGTTDPKVKLDIKRPGNGIPALGTSNGHLFLNDNGLWGMYFGIESATGAGWIQQMRNDEATAYDLLLQPRVGYVGINTTDATNTLDVNGNARFRSIGTASLSSLLGVTSDGTLTTNVPAFAPASGSGNYIQNQNDYAQSANMWISGTGQFDSGVNIIGSDPSNNWLNLNNIGANNYRLISGIVGVTNNGFSIRNTTAGRDELKFNNDGNATFSGNVSAPTLQSTVATGTAPLTVASTTKILNANADLLDDIDISRIIYTRNAYNPDNSDWALSLPNKISTIAEFTGQSNYPVGSYQYGWLMKWGDTQNLLGIGATVTPMYYHTAQNDIWIGVDGNDWKKVYTTGNLTNPVTAESGVSEVGYLTKYTTTGNQIGKTFMSNPNSYELRFNGFYGNSSIVYDIGNTLRINNNSGNTSDGLSIEFKVSNTLTPLSIFNDGKIKINNLANSTSTRLVTASSTGQLGNVADGTGYLYNNGSGTFSYQEVKGNTIQVTQNNHGFSVQSVIYNNAGTYMKAKADSKNTADVVGIVTEVLDANTFIFAYAGEIPGIFTDGENYYLSTTTSGGMTTTQPTSDGDIIVFLGTGNASGALIVEIDIGIEIASQSIDGSSTNEGALTVLAGTDSTSVIHSNTNNSSDILFREGLGIALTEQGDSAIIISAPIKTVSTTNDLATDHSYYGELLAGTAGESLAFGDFVYFKWSDKKWWKADCDTYATARTRGIAVATISADASGTIMTEGYIRDDTWDWGAAEVWLSGTAGAGTSTQPSTAGQQIQFLGTALSADIMLFKPSQDIGEK